MTRASDNMNDLAAFPSKDMLPSSLLVAYFRKLLSPVVLLHRYDPFILSYIRIRLASSIGYWLDIEWH